MLCRASHTIPLRTCSPIEGGVVVIVGARKNVENFILFSEASNLDICTVTYDDSRQSRSGRYGRYTRTTWRVCSTKNVEDRREADACDGPVSCAASAERPAASCRKSQPDPSPEPNWKSLTLAQSGLLSRFVFSMNLGFPIAAGPGRPFPPCRSTTLAAIPHIPLRRRRQCNRFVTSCFTSPDSHSPGPESR